MKKIFLSVLILVAVSLSLTAQDSTRAAKQNTGSIHKGGKQHHKNELTKDLNLTEDQKKELIANRLATRSKEAAIENDKNLTAAQKNEQLASLHKEQKEKKNALLSPEQKEKLQQAKIKHRQEEKEQAEKRRAEMKGKLSLTNEQDEKLNELAKANQAKMKAIRENTSLDPESKKKQMDELRQHAAEQRKAILTPEQQRKMAELKNERNKEHTKKAL